MFFANDNRDKVREENPGISFGKSFLLLPITLPGQSQLTPHTGQVGKMLGDKWKALTETERKPYDAKAAVDKKRYEEEKAKYNAVSSLSPASMAMVPHQWNSDADTPYSRPRRTRSLLKRPAANLLCAAAGVCVSFR
jgi:hypothetical protein